MYAALRYLPLADALAIAFVYPFIMLLMGWTLLKEQVGSPPAVWPAQSASSARF